MTERKVVARGLAAFSQPLDATGLAAFRIAFGCLMFSGVVRFWAYGWIDELYLAPSFHFKYWGFQWVRAWPGQGLYWHFAVMGTAALAIAAGAYTRLSAAVFFLTFTYAELIEKATYLNHYYLVSLMAGLLVAIPCSQVWSVDAYRRHHRSQPALQAIALHYWVLRIQVGCVYVFAGLAKINGDWLQRAEPLRTWLAVRQDLPLVGWLFAMPVTAFAMSYWGLVFDLSVVGWLLWRKTRAWAFGVLVVFHVSIWLLFPIGLFSWVMITVASLYLAPDWPRRFIAKLGWEGSLSVVAKPVSLRLQWPVLAGLYLLLQLAIPLRFLAYPPGVNWHEQGYRFSWRVMLTEKSGQLQYRVSTDGGQSYVVHPRAELTPFQFAMMRSQPDMIHEYALHLKQRFEDRTGQRVQVRADAWVSFNGRRSQRLIDAEVDLAGEPKGLAAKRWILPLEETPLSSAAGDSPS